MVSTLKENLRKKLDNKKGFTLAELLIVIAIIGVLIAIAIPTFKGALGKAEEATEIANARSVYAQGMIEVTATGYRQDVEMDPITYGNKTYTFTYKYGEPISGSTERGVWRIKVGPDDSDDIFNYVYSNTKDSKGNRDFSSYIIDGIVDNRK